MYSTMMDQLDCREKRKEFETRFYVYGRLAFARSKSMGVSNSGINSHRSPFDPPEEDLLH